ncbi:DNA-binding protein creA-like, partial [Colias croceus]|uniref:DNA-binding protein creA-like n=1 Tax=Colias crocea TaxID=72248 RepID=UPI001E27FCD6
TSATSATRASARPPTARYTCARTPVSPYRVTDRKRNYKCDFCNKSFRAASYRQIHMRTHTGEPLQSDRQKAQLQVRLLQQELPRGLLPPDTHAHAHRSKAVQMSNLRQRLPRVIRHAAARARRSREIQT